MITWFQRNFAKHNKWILMIFLVVLLLSFIVSIGAVPRGALTARRPNQQLFLGADVNNADEMQPIVRAVAFTFSRLYGQRIESAQENEQIIEQRIALKYLADQWQIPPATPKQIEDYVRTLPAFHDADGVFSSSLYNLFRDEVRASPQEQQDEAAAIIAEDCRIDRVRLLLAGPGYFLPGNAQTALTQIQAAQDNFKYSFEAATMDLAKFEPKIETDPVKLESELQKLFATSPDKFPQPAQVQLSFAKFPAAAVPEPTADQLHTFATAHKADYPGITSGNLTEKEWAAVATAWRTDAAKTAAMNSARELYSLQTSVDKPEFDAFVKKYNLKLQPLPMLIQGQPAPADSPIPDDTLQQVAFQLNPQQYFVPVPLADGAGIIFLMHGTPARASSYTEARPAVLKAYTEQEKAKQVLTHGEDVRNAITKDMAAGKSFHDAATANNLTVKEYTNVTDVDLRDAAMEIFNPASKDTAAASPLVAMGRDLVATLASPDANGVPVLLTLQPGEVSKMMLGAESGVIFHVTQRSAAQLEVDSPEVKRLQLIVKERDAAISASSSLNRLLLSAAPATKSGS